MDHYDPTDVAGQADQAKARALRERLARETEEADVVWLMQSQQGRRVVWRLLERAGVFRLSFSSDAMQMAFNEGNRNEGLRLLAMVHALTPRLYPVMVEEQRAHERSDDERSDERTGR